MNDPTQGLIALVAEALGVPPGNIAPDASMETLREWDSLGQLKICLCVQERYGIDMDMDAIASATSIPALSALVSRA
jgi:acyl carrier protein